MDGIWVWRTRNFRPPKGVRCQDGIWRACQLDLVNGQPSSWEELGIAFQVILEWFFLVAFLYFNLTYETILWLACMQLAMFCLLLWVLISRYLSAWGLNFSPEKTCSCLSYIFPVFFSDEFQKMISGLEVGLIQKRGVRGGWGGWAPGQERYDLSIFKW